MQQIDSNNNKAARRYSNICWKGTLTIDLTGCEQFQRPQEMELMDHSSGFQPQNQDGGSLSGWSDTAKKATHNLSIMYS
jgi:hypothetical protein